MNFDKVYDELKTMETDEIRAFGATLTVLKNAEDMYSLAVCGDPWCYYTRTETARRILQVLEKGGDE